MSRARKATLTDQLQTWLAHERAVWFLTLTFPHDWDDSLADTVNAVTKAFTSALRGRAWQETKARYGLVGVVRALEITLGGNGWHPHLHVLLFVQTARSARSRRRFKHALLQRFTASLTRAGYRAPDSRNCPMLPVDTADVGDYVAKANGAALELTAWQLKRGRGGSRTPFKFLIDLVERGALTDRRRWAEWEKAMYGRRPLTTSPMLRQVLRRLHADVAAAAGATTDVIPGTMAGVIPGVIPGAIPGTTPGTIPGAIGENYEAPRRALDGIAQMQHALWRRVCDVPGLDLELLAATTSGDTERGLRFLPSASRT